MSRSPADRRPRRRSRADARSGRRDPPLRWLRRRGRSGRRRGRHRLRGSARPGCLPARHQHAGQRDHRRPQHHPRATRYERRHADGHARRRPSLRRAACGRPRLSHQGHGSRTRSSPRCGTPSTANRRSRRDRDAHRRAPRRERGAGAYTCATSAAVRLSPREAEVLDLLRQGLRTNDIARRLFISQVTVRTHIASISEEVERGGPRRGDPNVRRLKLQRAIGEPKTSRCPSPSSTTKSRSP